MLAPTSKFFPLHLICLACTIDYCGQLYQKPWRSPLQLDHFDYHSALRVAFHVTIQEVAFSRLFLGLGICIWFAPLTAITFARFPHNQLATGQGIFHFFRILMGGVGTSIFVTIWDRRATHHHSNLVDSINPFNPISKELFGDLNQLNIRGQKALQVVDSMAWKQAYMLSLNDIFWIAGWSFSFFIILTLFFKARQKQQIPQTA